MNQTPAAIMAEINTSLKEIFHLDSSDPRFPACLRPAAAQTPRLFDSDEPKTRIACLGNPDLLLKPAIEICGTRKPSFQEATDARDIAVRAVQRGFAIVSGHAQGIDTEGHHAALQAGGSTILVLPEGISQFSLRSELRNLADYDKNILVISQWKDDARWSTPQAMGRNHLMAQMSKAVFAFGARNGTGGTWASCTMALKASVPLYITRSQPPSEAEPVLAEKGAILYDRGTLAEEIWKDLHSQGDER